MKYDLDNEFDRKRFITKVFTFLRRRTKVELTDKTRRSTSQNAYLHVLLTAMGYELGESLQYVKDYYYKRLCNADLFVIERPDRYFGSVQCLRSSADLTKEEMSRSIDRFKMWAYQEGYVLPEPDDEAMLDEIERRTGAETRL